MEEWKDIPGYNSYQVNKIGQIRSIKYGNWRILNPANSNGYLVVNLRENNNQKLYKVHRLVMFAFDKKCDMDINHKNGIKNDNRLENLEWCTMSENIKHSYNILGRKPHIINKGNFGIKHPKSKKVGQYTKDGLLIKIWDSLIDIERELEIYNTSISSVCRGKRKTAGGFIWKYI